MARPVNKELRSEVLNAFDKQLHLTIKEVNEHLLDNGYPESSYQSTRRTLIKMVREGLIIELPRRDGHILVYTKLMVNGHVRFTSYNEEVVSLLKFIDELSTVEFSPIFTPVIQGRIKSALLDYLAGHYPEPYEAKNREAPDLAQMEKALREVLEGTRLMHMFIRRFLDTPVDQKRLTLEFKTSCAEQHAAIVDRTFP